MKNEWKNEKYLMLPPLACDQGKRTVLEYLLSPVQKAVQEAGRER